MREIHIPYCRETLPLHVEEKNLSAVLTARMHEYDPGQPEAAIVQEALEHPIGTPRLRELAKGKKKVVLVTSDHTRAVPSRLTLPLLLAEIRAGQPDADITILIATGLHRPTTAPSDARNEYNHRNNGDCPAPQTAEHCRKAHSPVPAEILLCSTRYASSQVAFFLEV